MSTKYCMFADTGHIRQHVVATNVEFSYKTSSINHSPVVSYRYDYEFLDSFFEHVRFFRVVFDENGVPQEINVLHNDNKGDNFVLVNGWLSYSDFFVNFGFNSQVVCNTPMGVFFDSTEDLFRAVLKWGKDVADQSIREKLIDTIEDWE